MCYTGIHPRKVLTSWEQSLSEDTCRGNHNKEHQLTVVLTPQEVI